MKAIIRLVLLPLLLIFTGHVASANVTELTPANKIGVLNWETLLTESPQAKAAKARLDTDFQATRTKLMDTQKSFQAKQEKLQRDREVLSETERNKLEKELNKMQQELRHMDEEFRADYTDRHRAEMDKFVTIVREIVEKLAKEEKYALVLPHEATLYMENSIDVTRKVLDRLEKEDKSKGGKK